MAPSEGMKLDWLAISVVGGIHVLALAAFTPWLFSWTGVVLAIAGCYVFGTLGVNIGYHRLLSHRSFKCPLWLEHTFAMLGVCCLEKTPGQFVAIHRAHHQHSDDEEDPHSPLEALFWGHVGWALVKTPRLHNASFYEKYARDIFRDRFYLNMERRYAWLKIYGYHAALFALVGFVVGLIASGGSLLSGVQFGLSLLVWGVFVRTVLVWHITWSINSVGHIWGYRNYETGENSRNSLLIGLLTNGDGWHNNHHADQRSAAHGHKWWEFDVTFTTIRVLQFFGLAWDLVPIRAQAGDSAAAAGDGDPVDKAA